MSDIRFFSFFIVFITTLTSLFAQTKQDTLQDGKEIEEVVVHGERPVSKEVSAPHVSFSTEQKEALGATEVTDILKKIAGVEVKDYGGVGGLKTVSVRSLGASHTGVAIDAVPLSDCQTGQIDLSRFSLDGVSQIDLSIADNSDMMKTAKHHASASMIDMKSHQPDFTSKRQDWTATLKAGSFGLANAYIRYGHALARQSSLQLSGTLLHSDGQYPYTLKNGNLTTRKYRRNSETNSMNTEATLNLYHPKRGRLTTKAYYYYSDRDLPGGIILYNDDNKEHLKDKNFFVQTLYDNRWDKTSLRTMAKFNWAASLYHDEKGYYPNGEINDNYFQRELYGSAIISHHLSRSLVAANATDYTFNSLNSNLASCVFPRRHSLLNATSLQWSKTRLSASATMLTSLYRDEELKNDKHKSITKFSPTASASYWLMKNRLALRFGYKESFRMPTFSELYYERTGMRNIDPECTRQINVGGTFSYSADSLKPAVSMIIDCYHNWVKDKIVAIPRMFVWSIINMGKVETNGIEATANAHFPFSHKYSLTALVCYALQDAKNHTENTAYDGDQIPYTPLHSGSASLAFENPYVNCSYQLSAVGKRYSQPANTAENEIEAYTEHSISFYKTIRLKRCLTTLRADLLNITDKQYEIIKYYPMQGRSYKISLSVKSNH